MKRRKKLDIEQLNSQENVIRTCQETDLAMNELEFTIPICPICKGLYDSHQQIIVHETKPSENN